MNNFAGYNKKKIFSNPLSWSISRATLLYYCPKKYFFTYYTNALKTVEQKLWLETLLLKNLTSIWMWVGEKFHGLMSDYLMLIEKGQTDTQTLDKMKKLLVTEMETEFEISKKKDYSQYDKYNKFGFAEHFYGEDIEDKLEIGIQKVFDSFLLLQKSELHKTILDYFANGDKMYIESKVPDFDKMKLTIETVEELRGIVIWAQPDFGVVTKSDIGRQQFIIYDWKTGRLPEYDQDTVSDQLKVYAYKMLLNIGLDKLDDVDVFCREVFVTDMHICGNKVTREDIDYIQQKIIQDIANEKSYLRNHDATKNNPLPSEHFSRTEDTAKCTSCRFRKVCGDLKKHEAHAGTLFG